MREAAVGRMTVVQPGARPSALRALTRHTGALAGLVVILAVTFIALVPGAVAPHDPLAQDLLMRLRPPGTVGHLLGTDTFGRDLLSRLIWGARVSLAVSLLAVSGALLTGTLAGLVAGYFGRAWEQVIMRGVDVLMAFPSILLALVVVGVLGGGLVNLIVAVAIAGIPHFARLARGETLAIKEQAYVEAARAVGASNVRILRWHILRNALAPLVVLASLRLSTAILTESSLSFLGLGVAPPTPTWGGTVADGMRFIQTAPWIPLASGCTIMLTVLAFNLMGDGVRDVLDPRLRGEAGQRAE
jgi:peptide/nickel transport system permease protein